MTDQIVISEPNARVLRNLLRTRNAAPHDQQHLHELGAELDRALVLDPSQLSPTVVTLHAAVRVRDLESGQRQEVTLVSPREADVSVGRISVLAPLGTALIGYRKGDVVERRMPGGLRRLLIEEVVQAPVALSRHAFRSAARAPTRPRLSLRKQLCNYAAQPAIRRVMVKA